MTVTTADRAVGDVDEEAIPEADKVGELGEVHPGKTVKKDFKLSPGTYVVFCNIDTPRPTAVCSTTSNTACTPRSSCSSFVASGAPTAHRCHGATTGHDRIMTTSVRSTACPTATWLLSSPPITSTRVSIETCARRGIRTPTPLHGRRL